MIFASRRAEQFGQDGFQRVRPDLITIYIQVQSVLVRHPFKQSVVLVRQFAIDIQVPDLFSVRESGYSLVDPVYDGHHSHVVVARCNTGENNRGPGSLPA